MVKADMATERPAAHAKSGPAPRPKVGAKPTYACSISKIVSTAVADTVVVFVRPGCPHCASTLQRLQKEAIPHVVVPADAVEPAGMQAMSACLGGFSTFPRVFVRGAFHGGNDAIEGAVAAFKSRS